MSRYDELPAIYEHTAQELAMMKRQAAKTWKNPLSARREELLKLIEEHEKCLGWLREVMTQENQIH